MWYLHSYFFSSVLEVNSPVLPAVKPFWWFFLRRKNMGGDEVVRLWCAVTHSQNIAPGDLYRTLINQLNWNWNLTSILFLAISFDNYELVPNCCISVTELCRKDRVQEQIKTSFFFNKYARWFFMPIFWLIQNIKIESFLIFFFFLLQMKFPTPFRIHSPSNTCK